MIKLAVILEPCEEGGFSVHVPTVPGCYSEGETEEEALRNIREAIEMILEPVEDDLFAEEGHLVRFLEWEFRAAQGNGTVTTPAGPSAESSELSNRPRRNVVRPAAQGREDG